MAQRSDLSRFAFVALVFGLFMTALMPAEVEARTRVQSTDGTSIDLGIAYFLLFLALAWTYLIPMDTLPIFFGGDS